LSTTPLAGLWTDRPEPAGPARRWSAHSSSIAGVQGSGAASPPADDGEKGNDGDEDHHRDEDEAHGVHLADDESAPWLGTDDAIGIEYRAPPVSPAFRWPEGAGATKTPEGTGVRVRAADASTGVA